MNSPLAPQVGGGVECTRGRSERTRRESGRGVAVDTFQSTCAGTSGRPPLRGFLKRYIQSTRSIQTSGWTRTRDLVTGDAGHDNVRDVTNRPISVSTQNNCTFLQ